MPSGSAYFTNKTDEAIAVEGQTFEPGEATHVTDQGIIAQLAERKDFAKAKAPKDAES